MTKKKNIWIYIVGAIVLVGVGVYFLLNINLRNTVISKCDSSLDCQCFSNVIKYRFKNRELVVFNKFLNSLSIRNNANILEFTDKETAQNISYLVSLCRKAPAVENIQSAKDGKVRNIN